MSIDLNLISKVVYERGLLQARQFGVTGSKIEGAERHIWDFIEAHYAQFREVPSKELILQKFDVKLLLPEDSLEFYAKEVLKRTLHREMVELSYRIDKKLSDSSPDEAFEQIRVFVREQLDQKGASGLISTLDELQEDLKQSYLDAKDGKRGILTPWNRMDDWTLGWWPGDTSWVSARLGVGKTFMAIMIAGAARYKDQKKVLFISGEMSKKDIAMRLISIEAKMPYGAVRRGRLGYPMEEKYFGAIDEKAQSGGFEIMDASLGFRSSDLEMAMEKSNADLVVVDAAYRIKAFKKTQTRMDNMAEVADDLKTLSLRYKKPVVCTTQLNRDSTKKKSYGDEDVALSDVVGWNATNLFAIKQDEEDKELKRMRIFPLKVREGANDGEALEINWDMNAMNFKEYSFVPPPAKPEANAKDDWL